jgi:hypothetical protein
VASDEFLRRIDEHMARSNEHMARGNELMDEVRREHQLNRAAFAEMMRVTARLTEVLDRIDQSQRDLQDEVRAQTKAIFRLIDRFDAGGPGTAPA